MLIAGEDFAAAPTFIVRRFVFQSQRAPIRFASAALPPLDRRFFRVLLSGARSRLSVSCIAGSITWRRWEPGKAPRGPAPPLFEGLTRCPSVLRAKAALSEPPLPPNPNSAHMPLVHFLAVASHCMPAFLQAASVFGAPANAGAVKATTRLKARIETNAFIDRLLRFNNTRSKSAQDGTT